MIYFSSLVILIIIFFIINFLFKNLKSKFNKEHQKFAGKVSIPLIGGVIIFCYLIVYINLFENYFYYIVFFYYY
jgi:UDP-N-acetylmuramyl pentapeptide phosphotransferase/UDP-N-acetylglucosamine-1-phosphate transferase